MLILDRELKRVSYKVSPIDINIFGTIVCMIYIHFLCVQHPIMLHGEDIKLFVQHFQTLINCTKLRIWDMFSYCHILALTLWYQYHISKWHPVKWQFESF